MPGSFHSTAANVRRSAQRLLRGYLGASALSRGLGALGGLVVTIALSPGDRGIYAFFYAITVTVVQFGPFSLDQAVSAAVAKGADTERTRSQGIRLSLLTGAPLLVAIWLAVEAVSPDEATPLRLGAVVAAAVTLWWSGQLLAVVEGLGMIREKFLLHAVLPGSFMVLLLGLISFGDASADSLLVAFAIASFSTLFIRRRWWEKLRSSSAEVPRRAGVGESTKQILQTGLALSPSQAGTILLQRADILLGGALILSTELGQYAVASSFGLFASFYAQATARAAYASAAAGSRLNLRRPLLLHSLLCLLVGALGPLFTLVVYGQAYNQAAGLTLVLAVGWWFQGLGTILDGTMTGLFLVGRSATGNWIGVLVLVVLAIPFCGRWGAAGLAVATVVSNMVYALWIAVWLPRSAATRVPR